MSSSRRRSKKGGKQTASAQAKKVEFWESSAPLPTVEPIPISDDPSATLRSLGPPPLSGQTGAVESIVLVAARAAGVATALAAAADILSTDDR